MNNNSYAERLDYIDIFRALGIILMVMGHIGFGSKFDKFIHAFHMPMFFWISGFFYKKRNIGLKEFTKKKFKTLLVPYCFWGIVHYIINLRWDNSLIPLIRLLTINTDGLPIAGALWFLTALFFTDVFYFLLDKWNIKWLIIPLVLVGSVADQTLPYPLPWALSASFVGVGLFWFGNISRTYAEKLEPLMNMSWISCLLTGLVTGFIIFKNGYVNMRAGVYSFIPLFWINVLISIAVGISISKNIKKITKGNLLEKILAAIGRNSIVYVCLNQLIILLVTPIVNCVKLDEFTRKIVILVFSLTCLYWLAIVLTKPKVKILIGK